MAIEIVVFDDNGDLRLEVGPEKNPMIVCSRAMARASPVFKRMLFGGFKESKPTHGDWVVPLPDEGPDGFAIILSIIHGNISDVPKDMMFNRTRRVASRILYEVAVAADKYGLVPLLSPWANRWLGDTCKWYHRYRGRDTRSGWDTWTITTAWAFGDDDLLEKEMDQLVLSMHSGCTTGKAASGSGQAKSGLEDVEKDQQAADRHVGKGKEKADDYEGRAQLQQDICILDRFGHHMSLYDSTFSEHDILGFLGLEQFEEARYDVLNKILNGVRKLYHRAETEN
ncbi:hypothetical protein GE09DRAFT_1274820 [Coniochaeta sp. 2T2.1]|nr:hypothetical protein GE09DRAFT_1274820 [Coniochaeta sp. 2T2.1]